MNPSADAPRPLHDTAALRTLERLAVAEPGVGTDTLMQRAGLAGWHAVLAHWPDAARILVACGPGNNGGDGYVLARHALQAGREVRVVRLAGHAVRTGLATEACAAYVAAGGAVDVFDGPLWQADLVVDALFGIGLARPPDSETSALLEAIAGTGTDVLALDVPSGVDARTGAVPGAAIRARRTLQFLSDHAGLRTGPALEHVGTLALASLGVAPGILASVKPVAQLLVPAQLQTVLRPRRRNAHKGEAGHVLCVGGDAGHGGALMLCAEAALRAGTGLVSAATRPAHVPALLARRPEVMALGVDTASGIERLAAAVDVIAIGPGLGTQEWGRTLLDAALASGRPLVLDADALNLLAASPARIAADCVLTPHPGEAGRLLGLEAGEVQADRFEAARRLVRAIGCCVVLKGAGSLVAAPASGGGVRIDVIDAGNAGMAVGGMGDLLTGVIAALRAQGFSAFDAARFGALLHASAGDVAAAAGGERGLLPSDLLMPLRQLSNPQS
jgi:ADP-dependent NAD(P)H-hydrate dehydratase / NAD(P)H-hydrate epimerase